MIAPTLQQPSSHLWGNFWKLEAMRFDGFDINIMRWDDGNYMIIITDGVIKLTRFAASRIRCVDEGFKAWKETKVS
jgi:hypothetical protein